MVNFGTVLLGLFALCSANSHLDPSGYVYSEHSIQKPYLGARPRELLTRRHGYVHPALGHHRAHRCG